MPDEVADAVVVAAATAVVAVDDAATRPAAAVNVMIGAGCSGSGTALSGTWIHDTTVPSL